MSDDVKVRLTATDEISPVAKRAADAIKGVGQAAATTDKGFRGYRQSGQDAGRATDALTRDTKGLHLALGQVDDATRRSTVSLAAIGGAMGTVAGVMAKAGRAALDERREIDALSRALGEDGARAALDFADAIEDASNFTDEAVRRATLAGTSLVESSLIAQDELEALVTRSADLAELRGLSIEDVSQRMAA